MFALPETSATNILVRRAQRLRRITGNEKLQSEGERIQSTMTGGDIAMMTLIRPVQLMFREPIVFLLNLYIAFIYAILVRRSSIPYRYYAYCGSGCSMSGSKLSLLYSWKCMDSPPGFKVLPSWVSSYAYTLLHIYQWIFTDCTFFTYRSERY